MKVHSENMKIIVFTLILLKVVQGMPVSYRMHINTGDVSTRASNLKTFQLAQVEKLKSLYSNPRYSNHFYITAEAASNLNTLIQGAMKLFDPNHWEYKKQLLEKHFQQKYDILAQLGKAKKALDDNLDNPSLDEKNPKNPGSDIKNPTNPGVDTKNSNNPESEFDANNPGLDGKNSANPKVDADRIPSEIRENPTNPGVDSKNSNNPDSDGRNPEFDASNSGLDGKNPDNPKVDAVKIPSEIKAL